MVVVANRLPFDIELQPDGTTTTRQSPGGLVTALEPILSRRSGAWIGWSGTPDLQLDPVRTDGLTLVPVELSRQRSRAVLRGLLQRDALAAVPRRGRRVGVPPDLVGRLRRGEPPVRRAGGARSQRRARRSGCTTTSCSWSRRCCAQLRPDLRIGFFLHIPFPPTELFNRLPWRTADHPRPARRRPDRLPAARWRAQLQPAGAQPVGRRAARAAPCTTRAARSWSTRSRSRSTRRDGQTGRHSRGAGQRAATAGRTRQPAPDHPRRRPAGLHQGHRRPVAGILRAARREGPVGGIGGDDPDRDPEPRAAQLLRADAGADRAAGRRDQRQLRPDRRAGRALPASVAAPGGPRRVLRGC